MVDGQAPDLGTGRAGGHGSPHPSTSPCVPLQGLPYAAITHPMSRVAWFRSTAWAPTPVPPGWATLHVPSASSSVKWGEVCTDTDCGVVTRTGHKIISTRSFRTVPAWHRGGYIQNTVLIRTHFCFSRGCSRPCQAGPGLGHWSGSQTHPPTRTTPDGWPGLTGSMPNG